MGTAHTWANVLAEKQATATIINVGCIFASAMIKTKEMLIAMVLTLQRRKQYTKSQESRLYLIN